MIIDELFEGPQQCPECGGISFSDLILAEKKDACYYKVKASAKVWPSAYASGRLVQCRKKGAANYGNKSEGVAEGSGNWYVRVKGKVLKDKKFDAIPFPSQESARLKAMEIHNKKRIPLDMIKLTQSWMDGPETQGMAEAKPTGSRRDPLDLPPLEGPGGGGAGGPSRSGPSPFTPVKIPGTNINIPGVTQSTSPPPVVTRTPNINKQLDPALDVPAYVRKGLPDPVTTPVGKPKITVRPGETQSQAMQRTQTEKEFGKFLQGQGGQTFGTAGAGRGSQGGPTASQATSDANQVPTIKLPSGQTIPDPARLSPSGQYNIQSKSNPEMDKIMKTWDQQQLAGQSGSKDAKPLNKVSRWLLGIDEETSRKKRQQPEVDYDNEYDAMVARVKKLAGLGPMKTVYDPTKRVYRNMPTAQQPKK